MRGRTTLLALALMSAAGTPALAQNALGDGRALDNNLNVRSRYNTARPSLADELAFRNAIVTGNAPGGLSFRGEIGYRAPGEFTGDTLGSNDLFAFRRDSLRSGIAGMGIRGTEALQYQMALTTGSVPPANLVGRYSISRSGTGASGREVAGSFGASDFEGLQQRSAIDPEADDRGTMLWMLRSPSAYMSNSSLQTSALRLVEANEQRYALTASPLRGVRLSPVPDLSAPRAEDRTQGGRAAAPPAAVVPGDLRRSPEANPVEKLDADPGESRGPTGGPPSSDTPSGNPAGARPAAPGRPGQDAGREAAPDTRRIETLHTRIMSRLIAEDERRRAENVFDPGPNIQERVTGVMQILRGRTDANAEGRSQEDIFATEEEIEGAGADEGIDWTTDRERASMRDRRITFDRETMQMLRGDGEPLNEYILPNTTGRNFYVEHLQAGQELMAAERYFDAEERFAHALGVVRGDVTAQVARLHAQLGAGLFLSASLNLQSLAMERPEVFGVRYGENLLPSRGRLDDLIVLFQNTITPGTDRHDTSSPTIREASALLLAYVGHQLDRPEIVRQGLDDFRSRVMENVGPNDRLPTEARIEALFRGLWLPEDGSSDG